MTQSRIDRMRGEVQVNEPGKLMVTTLIAALAAMFVAITSLTSPELTASQDPAPAQAASSPTADFVYFPSEYSNQATGPSEHIQAF